MEVRPGTRRGGPDRGGSGAARWRGNPPSPEPRGLTRKCGGTEAARPAPGEALPDMGREGRARPGLCPPPDPSRRARGRCPPGGHGEKGAGSGSVQPLRARSVCVCMCSKSRPSWLPPRAKMGRRRAGGPRRSPGEVAGPLTTIAAIAARKEGICCAAITAPPLSTSSAGKAWRSLPPDLPRAPSLRPLPLPVRSRGGGGTRGWLEQTGTKRRCKPRLGPSLLRLIHGVRGEPSPGCFLEGWGSTLLLSFCAEQRARGLEEERGRWLRGLAALVLPLPGLSPSPAGNFPTSPLCKGAWLAGNPPEGPGWRGGSPGGVSAPGLTFPALPCCCSCWE